MMYFLHQLSDRFSGSTSPLCTFRAIAAAVTAFPAHVDFRNFVIRYTDCAEIGQPISWSSGSSPAAELHGGKPGNAEPMGGCWLSGSVLLSKSESGRASNERLRLAGPVLHGLISVAAQVFR